MLMLAVVVAAVTFAWQFRAPPPPPPREPPAPDLHLASQAVAAIIEDYRNQVLAQPASAKAWGQLGMVLFAHQFEPDAAECFEQAQGLDATEFRWPYLLALTVGVADADRAERGYRRALEIQPRAPTLHTRLGELLLGVQRYDDAWEEFTAALRQDERDVRARLGVARVLLHQGKVNDALSHAENAVQLAPENREPHELLAQIQHRLGDAEAARRSLAAASKFEKEVLLWDDPVTAEVLRLRRDSGSALEEAADLSRRGDVERAAEVLRLAISSDDRNPELFTTMTDYLVRLRRFDRARQIVDQGLRRHPTFIELRFKRGVVDFLSKDYVSAEENFRRVVEARPSHALAHYNLGHTYLLEKKSAEALASFKRAIEARPDYGDAHVNVAKLLVAQGQREEARRHAQTALKLNPSDATAQKLLKSLDSP